MQVGSAIVTVVVRSLGDRDRRRELNSLTSLRSGLSRDRGRPPEKSICSGDVGEFGPFLGDAREKAVELSNLPPARRNTARAFHE